MRGLPVSFQFPLNPLSTLPPLPHLPNLKQRSTQPTERALHIMLAARGRLELLQALGRNPAIVQEGRLRRRWQRLVRREENTVMSYWIMRDIMDGRDEGLDTLVRLINAAL